MLSDHDRAAQLVAAVDALLAKGDRDGAIALLRSELECAVIRGRTEAACELGEAW